MSTFVLEVITPEKVFYKGDIDSLTVDTAEGQRGVLAHHTPMAAALTEGVIRFQTGGQWKECYCSRGFMEVRPDEVIIMAQTVEWPEDIDVKRAEEAAAKARERLRQKQALQEYRSTQASLARALARLRVTSKSGQFME